MFAYNVQDAWKQVVFGVRGERFRAEVGPDVPLERSRTTGVHGTVLGPDSSFKLREFLMVPTRATNSIEHLTFT